MNPHAFFNTLEKNLKNYDDVELILLKGHLIIEQALNEFLSLYIEDKNKLDALNLMFAKKLDLLIALEGREYSHGIVSVKHLKELNRIRNKLAHQLEFHGYHAELKKWACSVVGYTPKTINSKKTYRNTLLKAFYLIGGYMSGYSYGRKAIKEEKSNNGI